MADQTTNAQRARTLFSLADDGRAGAGECIDAIERALNEAENRGSRQPMPADADTVEALKTLVRETLAPLYGTTPTVNDLVARTNAIAQVIIANFHIRLMNEEDEEEEAEAIDPAEGGGEWEVGIDNDDRDRS